MTETMTRWLEGVASQKDRWSLRKILLDLVDGFSTQPLTSAGLAISSGGATTAKTGSADFYALVKGTLVKIAASTTLPALTGINITAADFNVVCFFVDSAGTVTIAAGTQSATLGAVVFPPFPDGKALVGFLLITYSGTFTGGSTPLDTATTVYFNPIGPFDPSVLV